MHYDAVIDPIWHPFTPIPHLGPRAVFEKAAGAYLYDQDGKRYWDATSSWWCNLHGHCEPRLVEAIRRQASTLDQILLAPHSHVVADELAEKLLAKLGGHFTKIFYSDDGSTAVECALKMSLQYWSNVGKSSKRKFVSLQRSFHGDTLGAVGIGDVEEYHKVFQAHGGMGWRAMAPYCYRCPLGKTFPECGVACATDMETVLRTNSAEIAAVILEPLMLGAGGMIAYPKEYLDRIVPLCRELDILVIFDEVFTGFGRTGKFFAMEHGSWSPDIVCLSKGLTAGMMPMAVTATTRRIFEPFIGGVSRAFFHGHTYTGNGLGCAVALESLKIFETDGVMEKIGRLAEIMRRESAPFSDLPHVGNVRQLGMIWACELVLDRKTASTPVPLNGPGWSIATALWEKGFWIRPLHNIIYCVPPYCVTEAELKEFFSVLYSEVRNEAHYAKYSSIPSSPGSQ